MTVAKVKRFTRDEYRRLSEIRFFSEGDRLELIEGEIIEMAAKGTLHETCLRRMLRELPKLIGEKATWQCQSSIALSNTSEPEPDFAIVQNREDDYLDSHPTPAETLLIIEVADFTLNYDKKVKLPLYAAAGISDYWIFNMVDVLLETYREPYRMNSGKFDYRYKQTFLPNEAIALPNFPNSSLDLSLIFPPINSPKN
ncbi:MAG: Uma2 family endonuclease [Cyanobacteriota bacterium]|nr:Uma2 family endonuclease [Cyanobacteriota bacterium]